MEQSDLNLLQTVPLYHLQAILKYRSTQQALSGQNYESLLETDTPDLVEIAAQIFVDQTCREILRSLNEAEASILRELVVSGGRSNSRDLALYLLSPGSPLAKSILEKD